MDENLKYYLENTLVSESAIQSRLKHPITKLRYPTRLVYVLLRKYADDFFKSGLEPRCVSLAGLRGVGKTTLLWQTANHIYHNHYKDIYFFNVNTLKNLGVSLHIALEEFQRHIIKKRFNELSEPITLLFDEVHDDDHWSKTLKILYDEARTAFILCTGSSALLLNQTADLARRMRIEKIYPFKFIEFVAAKTYMENKYKMVYPERGLSKDLKEALFYSETTEEAFNKIKVRLFRIV
jgi:predicted AAA+ superfamily ATPase